MRVGKALARSHRLNVATGNANDWVVVELVGCGPGHPAAWAGEGFIGLGLLLLVFALLSCVISTVRCAQPPGWTGSPAWATGRRSTKPCARRFETPTSSPASAAVCSCSTSTAFKQVNDVYGTITVTCYSKKLGVGCTRNVFEYDTPGRLGGDEFAVVLRHLGRRRRRVECRQSTRSSAHAFYRAPRNGALHRVSAGAAILPGSRKHRRKNSSAVRTRPCTAPSGTVAHLASTVRGQRAVPTTWRNAAELLAANRARRHRAALPTGSVDANPAGWSLQRALAR